MGGGERWGGREKAGRGVGRGKECGWGRRGISSRVRDEWKGMGREGRGEVRGWGVGGIEGEREGERENGREAGERERGGKREREGGREKGGCKGGGGRECLLPRVEA